MIVEACKKKMSYKAVLFDLDGTLLNTLEDLCDAMNRVLSKKGFPTHKLNDYRYFAGNGAVAFVTRALPEQERNNHTISACLKAYKKEYSLNWNVKTKPYRGIPEMLNELTKRGIKMAILSNKPDKFTKQCVAELLPSWTFDIVLGQRDNVPHKPDPTGALEVIERLRIPAKDFLYLGDTDVDMQTAAAVKMFSVGVLWGFRSQEELKENGACALIKHPKEIQNFLD